jgi:hypothetical protein
MSVVVVVVAGPVVVVSAAKVVVVSPAVETVVDVSLPAVQAATARSSARGRRTRRTIVVRLSAWVA